MSCSALLQRKVLSGLVCNLEGSRWTRRRLLPVPCGVHMEESIVTLSIPGNDLMPGLVGQRDELLRQVEGAFPGAAINVRGNEITIDGDNAETVRQVFDEMVLILGQGLSIDSLTLERAIDMVRADESPSEVLTTEILRTARNKPVRPRSAGQKRYVEAGAEGGVTFAIGPAGTGKTYLAVGAAVAMLKRGRVRRLALVRPPLFFSARLIRIVRQSPP